MMTNSEALQRLIDDPDDAEALAFFQAAPDAREYLTEIATDAEQAAKVAREILARLGDP